MTATSESSLQPAVSRTREVSSSTMKYAVRIYDLPGGAGIHVHRGIDPSWRWTAVSIRLGDKGRCISFPTDRHITAMQLWQHRDEITSVYEFPREPTFCNLCGEPSPNGEHKACMSYEAMVADLGRPAA